MGGETDWSSPFQGRTLRIATFQNLPLSGAISRGNSTFEGVGVAFEVLQLLQRALNFSQMVLPPADLEQEALSMLRSGEADVVAALVPVPVQSRPSGVIFSSALVAEPWVILMRRPEESASGTGLLAPFDTNVWLATLGALVAMGPLMWGLLQLRMRLQPRDTRENHESRHMYPLSSCVWFAYSAIMKQGSTLAPANDVSRLLFATWWVFITIVTSFYTANLTAFLTLSRFTLPIEEARELPEHPELRWVGRAGGTLEGAIKGEDSELSYLHESLQVGTGRVIEQLTDLEILELVMHDHVYLGERSAVERLVFRQYLQAAAEGLDHSGRCTLVFTSKPFMVRALAFAFPVNSSLPPIFNPVIRRLVESGVVHHALRRDLPSGETCPLNLGSSERQLQNSDLLATYLAMATGFSIALIAFLAELATRCLGKRTGAKLTPVRDDRLFTRVKFVPPLKETLKGKEPLFLYPGDFTLPPSVGKSALLMDPHLFLVHRALNVRVQKPFRRVPVLEFTKCERNPEKSILYE